MNKQSAELHAEQIRKHFRDLKALTRTGHVPAEHLEDWAESVTDCLEELLGEVRSRDE